MNSQCQDQNSAGLDKDGNTSSKYGAKRCGEGKQISNGFRVADKRWTRQSYIAMGIGVVITFPGFSAADDVVVPGRALATLQGLNGLTASLRVLYQSFRQLPVCLSCSTPQFPSGRSGGCREGILLDHFHLHTTVLIPPSTYALLQSVFHNQNGAYRSGNW